MNLTPAQQKAIAARGNVLLAAGAGTGKTRTLVERCVRCLLHESAPAALDELLIVTFTEAAAAEMRQRLRAALLEESRNHPADTRLQEQLALFDTANIGTLHSFCFKLVRQHFYELELDPQLTVLTEEEAPMLAQDTLDDLLRRHYRGEGPDAEAVQALIEAQARGSDVPLRNLILRIHDYAQTLPEARQWLSAQLQAFSSEQPVAWGEWLTRAIADWRQKWLPVVFEARGNPVADNSLAALELLEADAPRAQQAAALARAADAAGLCPYGKKKYWVEPLADFFKEARFLASVTEVKTPAPLTEDWNWVRHHMRALVKLVAEFGEAFNEAKRELGVLDFHDLEQYALALLWEPTTRKPAPVAEEWRKKLRFVFVDEYQDINAAQDKIIECLSREGARANRFLVGDVKQSIYRFRLADPYIFQSYLERWGQQPRAQGGEQAGARCVIPMRENFRSREGLISFVNSLFPLIMKRELGGVAYDEIAKLQFGAPESREHLALKAGSGPCVELHWRERSRHRERSGGEPACPESNGAENGSNTMAQVDELEEADKEARFVALRLKALVADKFEIWDEHLNQFRPVKWSDIAILLRAPARKSQRYAREFGRLNVPLAVARGEFYCSLEVLDLLSLLQLLDNPLQDVPVVAVLNSPLVGLSVEDLAEIRLSAKGRFWHALLRWYLTQRQSKPAPTTQAFAKIDCFLQRHRRWRRLAREVSLSRCLDVVLAETQYPSWLLAQPNGQQRRANLERFLRLAQRFDQFQRQSLFRFLRFIEAQQEAGTEPELPSVPERDAVRLMSIHQSKGLEFPVVVLADLAKPFNVTDLRADIILDEVYGLCPQIKPPQSSKRYPSLPYWLARQRQTRELLGEELRLLYVAVTRARDRLILTGSLTQQGFTRLSAPDEHDPLAARSYADWVSYWFATLFGGGDTETLRGGNEFVSWERHQDTELLCADTAPVADEPELSSKDRALLETLRDRLAWDYPFSAATREPAKSSVTTLRRRAAAHLDPDTQGVPAGFSQVLFPAKPSLGDANQRQTTGVEAGNAHHGFLELVSLACVTGENALRREAQRLEKEGLLDAEETALLDFAALAAFWNSDVGKKIQSSATYVHRELPFTARFTPVEIAELLGEPPQRELEPEFAIIQGVADLAVIRPEEIWLVDFKTDCIGKGDVAGKVRAYEPQLRLYAQALSRIYRRPVSQCWLHFLALGQTVHVPAGANSPI